MTSTSSTPQRERDGRDWRPGFLEALQKTGSVTAAADAVGIHRTTAYKYRDQSDWFADQWEHALEMGVERLEEVAFKRAKESSDRLLIFLLKAHKPEKYTDRYKVEHAGAIEHRAEPHVHGWLERLASRTPENLSRSQEEQLALSGATVAQDDSRNGNRS